MPLSKVYDLLMKKRLVDDEQGAISLIQQQIGMGNLQTPGKMCPDEFGKLFSKGQFRTTLINTITKLQEEEPQGKATQRTDGSRGADLAAPTSQSAKRAASRTQQSGSTAWPSKSVSSAPREVITDPEQLLDRMAEQLRRSVAFQRFIDQDARQNFAKEVPLSLKIERYQRQKLLQGLKPERDQEQREQLKYLQSLRYIQKYEPDDIDPTTKYLRARPYEEFLKDPLGAKYKASLEEERRGALVDQFSKRIDFVHLE